MEAEAIKKVDRKSLQEQGLKCMNIEHITKILKDGNFLYVVTFSNIDMKIADLEKKIQSYYNVNYREISPLLTDLADKMIERGKRLSTDTTLNQYQLDLRKLNNLKTITTTTLSYKLDSDPKVAPEQVSISTNYGQFALMVENFDIKKVSVNQLKYFALLYNNLIGEYSLKNLNKFMSFICSYADIQVTIYLSTTDFIRNKIAEKISESKQLVKKQRQLQLDLNIKLESSISLESEYGGSRGGTRYKVRFNDNERAKKLLTLKYKS